MTLQESIHKVCAIGVHMKMLLISFLAQAGKRFQLNSILISHTQEDIKENKQKLWYYQSQLALRDETSFTGNMVDLLEFHVCAGGEMFFVCFLSLKAGAHLQECRMHVSGN